MDEEQIQEVQRLENERRNLEERIQVAKLDLKIEREKKPFRNAMLKMAQNTAKDLEKRDKFFTDVSQLMKESEKILKKVHWGVNLPGIRDEVYANVEEIIRYRKKESDERIRKHQKAMADENDFLMRDPEYQATIGRQKMLEQLEKELEEIDLQSAAEQAEIDKIAEEQQQVIESYEANIRELQTEIDNDEAEIAQIEAENARDTAPVAGPSAEQPIEEPNALAATEQPAAANVSKYFRKFEVFETLDDLVLPPDDESSDESMPTAERLLAIANAIVQKESNSSPTEARDESIPNQAPQPTGQVEHSYAQSQRANESNVVEANNAQPPLFVAPLAPAPQVHKRKESAPENVLPAKKAHFDRPMRSPVGSRDTSREPPQKSPRESPTEPPRRSPGPLPRQSRVELLRRSQVELPDRWPQRGSGFTSGNEPDLGLVKSEFPTEQKLKAVQPAQATMGATPSEVVSQLHGQHRGIERARHSNQSSASQPIETYPRHRGADNRSIGLPGSSGQSASKAPTVLPSAKATATATANASAPTDGSGGILRIHTQSRSVQSTTSRPAQRDDNRYTQRTGHREEDAFPGFDDGMAAFSGTAFHSKQSMFSTAKETAGNPVTASAVEGSAQKRANSGNETPRNRNEQPGSSRPDQHGGGDNEFGFEDSSFSEFDPNLCFNANVVSNDRSGETNQFDTSFNSDLSFTSRGGNDAGGAGGFSRSNVGSGETNEFDTSFNSDLSFTSRAGNDAAGGPGGAGEADGFELDWEADFGNFDDV